MEATAERSPVMDGGASTLKMARGEEDYRQHLQQAYRQELMEDKQNGRVIGMTYYYKGLGIEGHYHWRVRARHIIEQYGVTVIAPPLLGEPESHMPGVIDDDAPGWVYADV